MPACLGMSVYVSRIISCTQDPIKPNPQHAPQTQAVIPGGSSVPVLNQKDCDDVLMDFDDLKARGALMPILKFVCTYVCL